MDTRIAIIQKAPIPNNKEACINNAIQYMNQAKANKADIVVFGECWLCGYPAWIDVGLKVAHWEYEPIKEAWSDIYKNSIEINGEDFNRIKKAAKNLGILVIIGLNEIIKSGRGNGTIYNSACIIDDEGKVINHHRKLIPTFNEKLIHGHGDANGLKSIESPYGRLGVMICWEHWMPIARQIMHDASEDYHFALWPAVKSSHVTATKHYAFEGKCYVITVGQIMTVKDLPKSVEIRDDLTPDTQVLQGGSCIAGPDGELLLEPQFYVDEIIYFDLPSKESLIKEKMNLSVSGHYQRSDLFSYKVNTTRLTDED